MPEELTVAEFLKKYAKPYDSKTDTYDVQPFSKSFDDASKSSKIYNMHMYWTKQDPFVVKQFIEHYTKPGDIVLDAFVGTGMTGVGAMLSGRHAIVSDISPVCIHIAKNYTNPIEPHIFENAYRKLLAQVEPEISPLYKTKCHKCKNEDALIANTILSDVFLCPKCGNEVFFAGDGRWEKMKKGEKVEALKCNRCKNEFSKSKGEFVRVEPIEIRVNCSKCKVKGEAKAKPLDKKDWELYKKIAAIEIPYWYPKDVKFFGDEPKRNEKRGITHPYQMFSKRNLIALSIFWRYINQIKEEKIREKLQLLFTSIIFRVNLQYKWNTSEKGGMRMGTLYIPSMIKDMMVLNTFVDKHKDLVDALTEMKLFKEKAYGFVIKSDARKLSFVPDSSIDYAYYDPPYGSNINYSELNIMWEAWLSNRTDTAEEIIENAYQKKDRSTYESMMLEAMQEAFRVLKPNRWLTMIYSYTDASMYRVIQNIAHQAGFIDEGEVLHINSQMKTKSQLDSDVTQQRYLVINFKKPKNGERKIIKESKDIEYSIIQVIQEFLTKHPGKTRDYIYDQVIKQLFTTVQIQGFDLDNILRNFFRKVGNEWYAPGTLIKKEESISQDLFASPKSDNPEKEVVLKLQDFLGKYGRIPYSELREFYLRKVNIPLDAHRFDELVEENFVVEKGKVRLPSAEELDRKQKLATNDNMRTVNKLLDGTLNQNLSDEQLCDLVEFCYDNAQGDRDILYKKAFKIYGSINKSNVEEKKYKKIKKIAEICQIKSQ